MVSWPCRWHCDPGAVEGASAFLDGRCNAVRAALASAMRSKRAARFIRENPLFPFIPFGPIALFLGSLVMSAMALRGVRQIRRELAAA